MADGPPPGYVEVSDRIVKFYETYDDGSLVTAEWDIIVLPPEQLPEQHRYKSGDEWKTRAQTTVFLWVKALAYRNPDDKHPGVGLAWEPLPGLTPYTHDSELMNAETSAWGRALAAIGIEVKDGIASANEVRNRQGAGGGERGPSKPSDKQVDFIGKLVKKLGADGHDESLISGYVAAELTGGKEGSASKVIEKLKSDDAGEFLLKLAEAAQVWQQRQSDVPADDADFKQPALDDESDLPWEPARA